MLDQMTSNATPHGHAPVSPEAEDLAIRIGLRAENLFLTHQFYCSEAVMLALNHGLGGGLAESQAVALAAPYSMAMGESGCACGALNGSVLGIGLFAGSLCAFGHRQESRRLARKLHDLFKAQFGSTCCRVLTLKVKNDPRAHRLQCAELTAWTATATARLLVEQFPDLLRQSDATYLNRRESGFGGLIRRIQRWIGA